MGQEKTLTCALQADLKPSRSAAVLLMAQAKAFALVLFTAITLTACSDRGTASAQGPDSTFIVPKNELESALLVAATDTAHRAEFHAKLLKAPVYVRTNPASVPEIQAATGPDGRVTKRLNVSVGTIRDEAGGLLVTLFTDADRLNSVFPGEPWVRLSGRDALKLAARADGVALNPGLLPNVTWTAAEVQSLLATSAR